MENLEGGDDQAEMATSDRNSESSRLVSNNTVTKPSYINIVSNLSGAIFFGIIVYCCFKDGAALFSFHPTLMSFGWLMLIPCAINAVTAGDIATEWMPIRLRSARHWFIQLLAGTVIIVAFIVILSNKIRKEALHFVTLHAKFGLAAILFMIISMLGGLLALYSLKLKYYLAPIYTKLIHASAGLLTFILGVITILLGLFSNWWQFGDILRYVSFTLVLLVMVLTILRPSLKIYFRLKERLENSN